MKSPPDTVVTPETDTHVSAKIWRHPWRWCISLALAYHLFAVVVPPFYAATSGPDGPSPLAALALPAVRPYMQTLFLDHGYAFFAPNPGPLHLIRYRIDYDDGRETITGTLPDLKVHRPRLLYHRHFMLTESLEAAYRPPLKPPAPEAPPEGPNSGRIKIEQQRGYEAQVADWQFRRSLYEKLHQSITTHLQDRYPGGKVTITRVRHMLISPNEFLLEGRKPNDPALYLELPESEIGESLPMTPRAEKQP